VPRGLARISPVLLGSCKTAGTSNCTPWVQGSREHAQHPLESCALSQPADLYNERWCFTWLSVSMPGHLPWMLARIEVLCSCNQGLATCLLAARTSMCLLSYCRATIIHETSTCGSS
jgi:hypothetical protein